MSASTPLPGVPDTARLCGFSADLLLYQQEVHTVEASIYKVPGRLREQPPGVAQEG
jgi:hypothetical protein